MNNTEQATNVAEHARATLRHMAQHRMAPTPDNYSAAWQVVTGSAGALDPETRPMNRVDGAARADAAAGSRLAAEAAEAVRLANRRVRLVGTMTDLIETVCDIVPTLLDDAAWALPQFDALRHAMRPASGMPDRGQIDQVRMQLAAGIEQHRQLTTLRRDSLNELKSALSQWLGDLSALAESSGDYGQRLGGFAERIRQVDGFDQLTSALAEIVADTAEVRSRIDETRSGMIATVQRAEELETRVFELSQQLTRASTEMSTDHLTGLLNRRGLEDAFQSFQNEARLQQQALALVMLDLDDFKAINDRYGHPAGDEALRQFGDLLRRGMRPGDRAARYGGEEFALLLPGAPVDKAVEVVHRLQRQLAERALQGGPRPLTVTFSAGVSAVVDGSLERTIEAADDALYEAKREGKNRVRAR
ncbi:MAG: diguanylate cyclase [Lautropia sp.]